MFHLNQKLTEVTKASFHCHHSPLNRHFSVASSLNSDLTVAFYNITFLNKIHFLDVVLDFLYSDFKLHEIPRISAASEPQRLLTFFPNCGAYLTKYSVRVKDSKAKEFTLPEHY